MSKIDRALVQKRYFRDISLSFAKHPVTDDIGSLTNEDAIKRSVENLVRTKLGERFYAPRLGSEIENSLFENADEAMAYSLEDDLYLLLENFEPRINNIKCQISVPIDTNNLNITIAYDIVGLTIPRQNVDFILQSTRI
jgi:phage baseplate assembly protein W|tara:strand:- start:31360 stop:31776 length:417 start_codon:yes stop_codon:yes gene_type:complete